MLGTHFEPRRGEMSHICDISLLGVKVVLAQIQIYFKLNSGENSPEIN